MKPIHFIPPLLALLIAGGWLGSQHVAISGLEGETAELRERIRLVNLSAGEAGGRSLANRMKDEGPEDGEIDWKDLAEKLAQANQGGMQDMRAMMELQTLLMGMEADELLAELDRIEGLELNREVRQGLENMLIGMLAQKEPKLVLERYVHRMNDDRGGLSWNLANSFKQWQKKEPAAALAWLDAEIAKGTFESKSLDGRNGARIRFESAAIAGLLKTDLEAGKARALAMPEDQRIDLFRQGMVGFGISGNEEAFADLVRSVVPEGQWGEAYEQTVNHLMRGGGYEKVAELITEIDADGKERDAIVKQAVKGKLQALGWENKVDREAVDQMRDWVQEQAPENVDSFTGEALSSVWGDKSKLEQRVVIVEELLDDGAGDDLIMSFLETQRHASETREMVRPLVERISDSEKREKAEGWMTEQSSTEVSAGATGEAVLIEEVEVSE